MRLAWINKLDQATLSAAGLVANLPIQNAQVNPPGLPARISATAMTVDFDFGSSTPWRVFVVLPARQGGDLSPAATIRIALSDAAAGGSEVYDSGTVATGIVAGYPQVYHVLPSQLSARFGRIALADATLPFLDVGRLAGYGGAGHWEPSYPHQLGRELGHDDASVKRRTLGGQLLSRKGARARVASFVLADNPSGEMFAQAFALDRDAGLTGDLLVMLDEANNRQQESLWGTLERVTPLTRHRKLHDAKRYTVRESL